MATKKEVELIYHTYSRISKNQLSGCITTCFLKSLKVCKTSKIEKRKQRNLNDLLC